MCLYSLKTKTRMVLHRLGWSQERLAREAGVTTRQIYNLLNGADEKRRVIPKGAECIERLFNECYPDPVPKDLRFLSDRIHRIAWLKANRRRYREEFLDQIAYWLNVFRLFKTADHANREEQFVHCALRGHVYFAAACDVSRLEKDHEHAALFAVSRKPEYMRKAIDAFQGAARYFAFAIQPVHMRARYQLFWATTMCNLGVGIFMAWSQNLIPSLTLDGVKGAFAEYGVAEAMDYLYQVDPKDASVPFNMSCWSSVLEDAKGCKQWFDRLVEAEPALHDCTRKLEWMNRSIAEDPDFAYLIKIVAPSLGAQAA